MANNLHSSLDDSQLHVPKGFTDAANNTYLTKNSGGSLVWAGNKTRHYISTGGYHNGSGSAGTYYAKNFSADYNPKIHGPSEDLYGFRNFYQNYYLPQEVGITYDLENKIESEAATKTIDKPGVPKKVTPEIKAIKGEEFEYQGKIYTIPERFKGQSLPETLKKSIASQQDKFQFAGLNENNPQVQLAQDSINRARAAGNDDAVEAIKDQLRKDLRVSNLEGLIK